MSYYLYMAPNSIERFTPLVNRFLEALSSDWQLTEAMAIRANEIRAKRAPKEAAQRH